MKNSSREKKRLSALSLRYDAEKDKAPLIRECDANFKFRLADDSLVDKM